MKRLRKCIFLDMTLQMKYGLYGIYALITVLYILMLKQLPDYSLVHILPFIIFSDPSVLGFFFIGGLILLEKGENVLEYVTVTPLRVREYILSKIISLTLVSLGTSFIIRLFAYDGEVNHVLLFAGIVLTSILFILIGFIAVAKFSTVNDYLMKSIVYIIILYAPIVEYLGIYKSRLFYIFPTKASILLIKGAFTGIGAGEIIYSIAFLIVAIAIGYQLAIKSFNKFIVLKEGEN